MSSSSKDSGISGNKYKGIRRRKWGKWVSEIRVPGTSDRLWLGSYATPEAAAVAHDIALYHLRGNSSTKASFNFAHMLPTCARVVGLSPTEVQKAASDAGMAIDASLLSSKDSPASEQQYNCIDYEGNGNTGNVAGEEIPEDDRRWDWTRSRAGEEQWSISVDDYLR